METENIDNSTDPSSRPEKEGLQRFEKATDFFDYIINSRQGKIPTKREHFYLKGKVVSERGRFRILTEGNDKILCYIQQLSFNSAQIDVQVVGAGGKVIDQFYLELTPKNISKFDFAFDENV